MEIEKIIKKYFKALEVGSYENMMRLFTEKAIILSPLYGKMKAVDFYRELFKDTSKSKITLLNIFKGKTEFIGAGHFRYNWILKDGTLTSFECVDIFRFSQGGRIKMITIIYDTSQIRSTFEKNKMNG
jgi:hypothetical protein